MSLKQIHRALVRLHMMGGHETQVVPILKFRCVSACEATVIPVRFVGVGTEHGKIVLVRDSIEFKASHGLLTSGAILRWRSSYYATEQISEMFRVEIAHPYANLKHTDVRIPQQLLCTLDAALNDILMGGDSSSLFEDSRKVKRTHRSG
jgi:hypothetical protein